MALSPHLHGVPSLIPVTSLPPGAWDLDETVSVGAESPGQGGAAWLWVGSSPCQHWCVEGTLWVWELGGYGGEATVKLVGFRRHVDCAGNKGVCVCSTVLILGEGYPGRPSLVHPSAYWSSVPKGPWALEYTWGGWSGDLEGLRGV